MRLLGVLVHFIGREPRLVVLMSQSDQGIQVLVWVGLPALRHSKASSAFVSALETALGPILCGCRRSMWQHMESFVRCSPRIEGRIGIARLILIQVELQLDRVLMLLWLPLYSQTF